MALDGCSISSRRSLPTLASHRLNGSAFFEGIDWIILNIPSVSEHIMSRLFPSSAINGRGVQIVPQLEFSSSSRCRNFLTYCFGSDESVRACTTSLTEKYQFPSKNTFLISSPSKRAILLILLTYHFFIGWFWLNAPKQSWIWFLQWRYRYCSEKPLHHQIFVCGWSLSVDAYNRSCNMSPESFQSVYV